MPTGAADARLRAVSVATFDVFDPGFLDGFWAGLENVGPGPDLRGLFCWASLLYVGVSQSRAEAATQDQLEGAWDLRHVLSCDLLVCYS